MRLDWEIHGVLDDFRRCQNTDLIFHCVNGHVSAHQMIFAGISPLFTNMELSTAGNSPYFTNLMQRYLVGQELIPLDLNVSLPEIRREHLEMVVEMVYMGQVRMTKRNYQPFREICQLLDLCVPIADYDKFFMNQCDDDEDDDDDDNYGDDDDDDDDEGDNDGDDEDVVRPVDDAQFVHHSEPQLPEVSKIPSPSCSSPGVFVCGECDAVFPLKIDLTTHKESRHGETKP